MVSQLAFAFANETPHGNLGHPERQYLGLMKRVWNEGSQRIDRTGIGTRSIFGASMRFELSNGRMPLITTKRVYWKTATRELLWFLTGNTNIRPLVLQGVKIWNEWPHAHYVRTTGHEIDLDAFVARIAEDAGFAEKWGDLGPVYGKQWVDWAVYDDAGDGTYRKREKGVNQVSDVIDSLRNNPGSRRHIIEGWNVAELNQMALPPCHKTYQFHVADGKLNGLLYQRSCDVALGLPFNLWSGALLQRMLAHQCDLEPGEFVWSGGDVHLYLNHQELIEEQITRTPTGEPRLVITRRPSSIFEYEIDDFMVTGYTPQAHIAAQVAV